MELNSITKIFCGIIFMLVPVVQFGGYILLRIMAGKNKFVNLSSHERDMFRAGHGHAGILSMLAIIAQLAIEATNFPIILELSVRVAFVLAPLVMAIGFFGLAFVQKELYKKKLYSTIHFGALILLFSTLALGIGLILNS